VRASGKPTTYLGGYGFSMGRRSLLEILGRRATDLGVDIRYEVELTDESQFGEADLVIACDSARSRLRERHTGHFGTHIDIGRNKYIWLGTPHVFDTFTFGFERTEAGWIWFHAYPFDEGTSTFIVECAPETWTELGFDGVDATEGCARLADIFAKHLDGQPLVDHRAAVGSTGWLNFRRITNDRWSRGNLVLMGDAAHTTHFAIGSGTKLAMQDAIALSEELATGAPLPAVLEAYERRRTAAMAPLQRAAKASSEWFERLPEYIDRPASQFAFALLDRRGEFPAWRYLLHVATQPRPLRAGLRWALTARKWTRVRRRMSASVR